MRRVPRLASSRELVDAIATLAGVGIAIHWTPRADLRQLVAGLAPQAAFDLVTMLDGAAPEIARLRGALRARVAGARPPRGRRGRNA